MNANSTQVKPYKLIELAPNSFIFEIHDAIPDWLCDEMINRFEANPKQQHQGRIGQRAEEKTSIKKTTDLLLSGRDNWQDIDAILHKSLGLSLRVLQEHYPFFKGSFKDIGYGIQRYRTGEYYHWHIDGGSHAFAQRQLVALWYLNDVSGPGGETEFLFQKVKVTPAHGKLVLFPPFWTHEHRSVKLQKGLKYIATTWVVFA